MNTFLETIKFFGTNISFFSILINSVIGGFVGVVIALVLLLSFRKYIYVERSNAFFKILKYSYLIIIPLLFIVTISSLFTITSAKKEMLSFINVSQEPLIHIIENNYPESINIPISTEKSIEENLDEVINYLKEVAKKEFSGKGFWEQFEYYVFYSTDFTNSVVKNKLRKLIADKLSVSDSTASQFIKLSLKDILTKDMMSLVLQAQVNAVYKSLVTKLILVNGFILLAILFEIIYANRKHSATAINQQV